MNEPCAIQTVEVLAGSMIFKLGRKTIVAKAGDVVAIPVDAANTIASAGVKPVVIQVEIPPSC